MFYSNSDNGFDNPDSKYRIGFPYINVLKIRTVVLLSIICREA